MLHTDDLRQALSWVIQDIHRQGWAAGTGGNFSALMPTDSPVLLMAPSGVDKGLVRPEDLIEVNPKAEVISGKGKASAETLMHWAIVEETGARAVLHTHSIFNTLVSGRYAAQQGITLTGYEMLKGLAGVTTHETEVTLPILANSQDLADLSRRARPLLKPAVPGHSLLIANHGLYVWGDSLFTAQRHLEIWEFLLEVFWRQNNS